jgi:hypothetical protein
MEEGKMRTGTVLSTRADRDRAYKTKTGFWGRNPKSRLLQNKEGILNRASRGPTLKLPVLFQINQIIPGDYRCHHKPPAASNCHFGVKFFKPLEDSPAIAPKGVKNF